jgi:hypothetical protein
MHRLARINVRAVTLSLVMLSRDATLYSGPR